MKKTRFTNEEGARLRQPPDRQQVQPSLSRSYSWPLRGLKSIQTRPLRTAYQRFLGRRYAQACMRIKASIYYTLQFF